MYVTYTGGTVLRTALVTLGATLVTAAAIVAPVSAAPAASPQKDIAQVAASSPQFTTLVSLLKKAGLVGALKKGSYTVFAPTNAAFAKLPKATLTAVGKDPALLAKVLTYHVVKGKAPASAVVRLDGKSVKTLEGQRVAIAVRGGQVYLNGTTRVTKTNVMASNGVIHVINRVLVPTS
jgi:uncharacterized surface protein with fasciclin (FAS1) repeats